MRRTRDTEADIQRLGAEKSNLLLEAQMLQATGREEEAIARFAQAAPIEERIAEYHARAGDAAEAARHRFSAASCWARAGNLHGAVALFDALGRDGGTPGRLKVDALLFAGRLREQQRRVLQSYAQTLQGVGN